MNTTSAVPFERPLAHWMQKGPLPIEAVLRLGRDLAMALTSLHLHDRTAGAFDSGDVWTREDLACVRLRRRKPAAQCGDDPDAAIRQDLAALGRLLFSLLTGKTFQADVDLGHLRQGFPIVQLYAPRVPADVNDLVVRLLDSGPGARYERAKQVFDDLRRICDAGSGDAAKGPPPVPVEVPAARRATTPAVEVSAVVAVNGPGRALRGAAGLLTGLLLCLKLALPVAPACEAERFRATTSRPANDPGRPPGSSTHTR